MKILIVEDEKRQRDGLYNLIKKSFRGLKLLTPVSNGVDGLQIIRMEKPEIIISDIQMSDLSGIEMIKKISEKNYSPYIIIISGFSNFEYARESLFLGVKEYILKPFTKEIIIASLSKAIKEVVSSDYLSDMFNNRGNYTYHRGYLFLFKYTACINPEEVFMFLRGVLLKYSDACYSIDEYLDSKINIMAFFLSCTDSVSVGNFPEPNIYEINHKIKMAYKGNITGAWLKTKQPDTDLLELKEILYCHCFFELPLLIGPNEKPKLCDKSSCTQYPYKHEKDLIKALYKRDLKESLIIFNSWLDAMVRQEESSLVILEYMNKLIFSILNVLKEVEPLVFKTISLRGYTKKLYRCTYKEDLLIFFTDIIELFIVDNRHDVVDNKLIYKVINHIKDHVCEPLTLDETADHYQISSEHLSRLFKEETGSGFNNYVNRSKIDIAKAKLQNGDMKIFEVSNFLSFSSSRYFSKVFKRVTSYTPKEYRELLS